ncbi:MAG: hypothetical protein CVV50_01640 [Spirochaetae bacterium HGW-Spirochaetae-6]|nr:MAG: hypothetical protein CVV50_01640 [Spirochaetae bacterium HGW-Spirochaetae-6]
MQGLLRDKLALDFHMVEEQASFDGDFPTVSSPNPEDTEALDMAVQKAVSLKADLVMGTDPDSDRLGVIIRHQGEYLMLNGNQLGIIMLGYLLKNRNLEGKKHYVVSTIVSSDMVIPMCEKASLDLYITLTGFKYIGGILTDKEGDADHFLFGFEESYGYLNGDYIRDKDGVSAAGLVCEVAQALKDEGKTLMDYLEELFLQYGYYRESLSSFTLKGQEGNQKIEQIINYFREQVQTELFGMPVLKKLDLKLEQKWEQGALEPFHDFPKSNVLVFYLAPHFKLAVRPSGTEPKIKLYFGINNYQNRPVSQIILKNELQNFENSILEGVKKLLS